MTITGTTFDKMRVTPSDDAALYHALNRGIDFVIRHYKNQMKITTSGLNMYVDTGAAVVRGRFIEITEKETISIPANTSGYLAIVIDLTQDNTSTGTPGNADYLPVNNQVKLQVVDNLVQQEIFKDGKIWMMPIVAYKSSGSSIAITKNTPTSYVLEQISGSPWSGYYQNSPTDTGIVAWDMGEFYIIVGYFTLNKQLAAGASAAAFKLPINMQPLGGSYDKVVYTGKRFANCFVEFGTLQITIGDIYNVNDTGLKAQGPGGWYSFCGMMIPKENDSPIDRNATSDK